MFRSFVILAFLTIALTACDKFRTSVTDSGLKYQFHQHDEKGRLAKLGDIMTFHLVLKNSKDSVLRDTHKEPSPLKAALQPSAFKGSFEEGLALLAKGDSASFFVNADSLFTKAMQPLPPSIGKGSDVTFVVKVLDVQTREEYEKGMELSLVKQKQTDAALIEAFAQKAALPNLQRTQSGVVYSVKTPGSGPQPAPGDSVQVRYTGKLLDGKVFDSNVAEGITFPVGMGMVIPGWDEGVLKLHKGDKATLLIPSGLAYGERGAPGAIPPNSVLTFEVELVNVKKGAGARPR